MSSDHAPEPHADEPPDDNVALDADYFRRFAESIANNVAVEPAAVPSVVVPFDSPLRAGQPTMAEWAMSAGLQPESSSHIDATAVRRTQLHHAHVAAGLGSENAYQSGLAQLRALGYDDEIVDRLSEQATTTYVGLANPWVFGPPAAGAVVVDIGCGAGGDLCYASELSDGGCTVIGVDVTREMLRVANGTTALHGRVAQGDATQLPLATSSADVVTMNGLLCIVGNRSRLFAEVRRVLVPGGEVRIADIGADAQTRTDDLPLPTRLLVALSDRFPVVEWTAQLLEHGFVDAEASGPMNPFSADYPNGWLRGFVWRARTPRIGLVT